MNERESIIYKRDSTETKKLEESNIKRIKLDDDLADSSSSSSRTYSASDPGCFSFSTVLSEQNDHRSFTSEEETNEIATNTRLQFSDLEEVNQISETEISTLINNNNNNFRKQVSENLGETSEMDSATTEKKKKKDGRKTEKSPTKAELDDFFSASEKYEQKRFTAKYNYDIVNDTPLEGRYQWVSLKP
ncbi:hypothetical protein AALP_AA4G064400 [Arabis alpina]|uniref:Cyclin-dependent kinase inhibitor domain-containing protein n=1 Tax=Arabis alpina TaxID=50452 RepID=A0A087H1J3_ARAAL|nr:hypothetical protein AALP_AA4G064400 [Arabis alpina]